MSLVPRPVLTGLLVAATSVVLAAGSAGARPRQDAPPGRSGEELFRRACAQCHRGDGRGVAQEILALPTPVPDFTDCAFASREPDADWGAIISGGGPVRAFDRMMPAFGDALTGDEIQRVLDHVRTFCAERAWPRGELNLPRPLITEKAFPEDELVVTTTAAAEGDGQVETKVVYEQRFGARNQVELVLPVAAHARGSGSWTGGVGDLAIGMKRAIYHSLPRGAIVSATAELVLPTGDEARGLGKGVAVFEPFVTFGQILPSDGFLQVQGGVELPFDTDTAPNEAFWRVAIGKSFTQGRDGRTWSPMIEVLGARELVSGEASQWDLLPQVQVTLSTRQHIMLNVGVRLPVSDAGPRPTRVLAYLLWDWFDGGFFDGW